MEKNQSQIKSGAILSYLSIITNVVCGLIITKLIVSFLGDTESSLYNMIGALVGYISVLDLGIGNAITRYVAWFRVHEKDEEQTEFLGTAIKIYLILALMVIVVGACLIPFVPKLLANEAFNSSYIQLAQTMLAILVINLAFSMIANAFPAIMNGYGRFAFQKLVTWIKTILRFIIVLILLFTGFHSLYIVLVDTILNILVAIIFFLYVRKALAVEINFSSFNRRIAKEILNYSIYIFLDMLINQVYWKLGQLILGIVSANPIEINSFAYGMAVPNYYIMISTALATMFMPTITKILTEQDAEKKLTNLLIKVGRIQLIVLGLILVGFIAVGQDFVHLWLGSRYDKVYYIAAMVMLAITIPCFQNICIVILQAKNQMRFRVLCYSFVCVLNILIALFLSPSYGAMGAAIGTVFSLVIGNIIIMNIYYHKVQGLDMIRSYKEILKGNLANILISIFSSYLIFRFMPGNTFMLFIVKGIVVVAIYGIGAWFIALNKEEKAMVTHAINKILKRESSNDGAN
jgi:O-antigen/teichoic acid export membrane protein